MLIIQRSQALIYNGSYFSTTTNEQYQNQILNCDQDTNCVIQCNQWYSCRNATVNCPQNSAYSCNISCLYNNACAYMNINWFQGANNSLVCDGTTACYKTPYPPSSDDFTLYTITCDEVYECYHAIITCPKHATCTIKCYDRESCDSSIIYCPLTANCNVECIGAGACSYATVYWPPDHNLANLICPDGGWQCNFIKNPISINSSTTAIWDSISRTFDCTAVKQCTSSTINCPEDGDCIINCMEESCAGAVINCPTNGDCRISCDGTYSCWAAIFNGPIDNEFTTFCSGDYACYKTSFHAEHSSHFNFTMGSSTTYATTARAISIWFPPRDGLIKRAYIVAQYGFNGNDEWEPQLFYALNGWLDVDLVYLSSSYSYHGGIMHCHTGYTDSCWFADLSYSCESSNTICEHADASNIDPGWISGIPTMPSRLQQSSIGCYQDTIYIIGGYYSSNQLTEYTLTGSPLTFSGHRDQTD